jgi:hypothetical protein
MMMIELTAPQTTKKPGSPVARERANAAKPADSAKDDAFRKEYNDRNEAKVNVKEKVEVDGKSDATQQNTKADPTAEAALDKTEQPDTSSTEINDPELSAADALTKPVEKAKVVKASTENAFGELLLGNQKGLGTFCTQQADGISNIAPGDAVQVTTQTKSAALSGIAADALQTLSPSKQIAPTISAEVVAAPAKVSADILQKTVEQAEMSTRALQPTEFRTSGAQVQAAMNTSARPSPQTVDAAAPVALQANDSPKWDRNAERREGKVAARFEASPPSQTPPSAATISSVSKPTGTSPQSVSAASTAEVSDLKPIAPFDLDAPVAWESRTSSSSSLQQVLARPETPVMVSRQMAEALQRFPDRPVELALNPEELGRVRMSISSSETGLTVTVLAERPETLDMMRRHIDQLAREFHSIGYGNINFAFSEGHTGANPENNDPTTSSLNTAEADVGSDPDSPILLTPSTGLDLRM